MRHLILIIRRYTSLTLFMSWLIVGVTGFLLLISPLLTRLGYYIPSIITDLHTYAGFTSLGISVIHISLNWNALKSYLTFRRK